MDRDEILKRTKQSSNRDEGVQYIEMQSRKSGEIGLCIFFLALFVYKSAKGLPTNDLLAIICGYLGVGYIRTHRYLKTKKSFVTAICGMIAAVLFTVAYIRQTW